MGINRAINSALQGIAYKLAGKYAEDVAEGRKGPGPQKAYLWAKGKKTLTGFGLNVTGAVALAVGAAAMAFGANDLAVLCGQIAGGTVSVGVLGVAIGLLDRAWTTAGVPAALRESRAYQWLLARHGALATLCATLAAGLAAAPTGPDITKYTLLLVGATTVLVTMGLLEPTWKSAPPIIVPGIVVDRTGDVPELLPTSPRTVEAVAKREEILAVSKEKP